MIKYQASQTTKVALFFNTHKRTKRSERTKTQELAINYKSILFPFRSERFEITNFQIKNPMSLLSKI